MLAKRACVCVIVAFTICFITDISLVLLWYMFLLFVVVAVVFVHMFFYVLKMHALLIFFSR
jgi:hypothetical protein